MSNKEFDFSCSLTDAAYEKIGCLAHLTFLDLCGAQVGILFNFHSDY